MIILLAAVAVSFVVRPWEYDRASNGDTTAPAAPSSSITFDGMRDFVTGYYRDLPAHPLDAWAKLDAYSQEQTGLNEFVDFWATLRSLELISVNPRDATSIVARLRYVRHDGQTDTEDRWLQVTMVNGTMLLHESERIGSVDETPALTPASPALASAQPSLADADLQGFLNFPGARCNYTNPAVVIAKTSDSLVVICQTGVGRYYYRGFGLQNGLSVEIDDPVRNGLGFVATNNGVQYSVAPDALLITQGFNVLSHEPTLGYWSG